MYCTEHPMTRMICPRCIASKGGRKTTAAYADSLSKWGKSGGRPTRKKTKPKKENGPAKGGRGKTPRLKG